MTDRADQPRRAIVVEDELLVAMYVEDLLTDLGFEVVAVATELDQALTVAETERFELAVLDMNLNGRLSFPVADVLRFRRIPFVFATGYGPKRFLEAYPDAVGVQKPFRKHDLATAIVQAGVPELAT